MPTAGHILLCKDFVFSDKSTGKKLVIALNTCDDKETSLVLKTTSQKKYYYFSHPGCNSLKKCFCIYAECKQGLDEEYTFVQLDYIYPINVAKLLTAKQISFIDRISEICFANLKRCLRKYKDDIPVRFWTLIYSWYYSPFYHSSIWERSKSLEEKHTKGSSPN